MIITHGKRNGAPPALTLHIGRIERETHMEGLSIRDMTAADIREVSAVRITGWKSAYAGLIPQDYLDGLSVEADSEYRRGVFMTDPRILDLVAVHAGTVVGWGVLGPCRDEGRSAEDGEIYALYVAPSLIGTGVGRTLMGELIARAVQGGFRSLSLWVLAKNHRARRFYERAGFSPDGEQAQWAVGQISVPEVRYFRPMQNADDTLQAHPPSGRCTAHEHIG
jgi:ribosomal protein S18 acetylase RimI-like enzyme